MTDQSQMAAPGQVAGVVPGPLVTAGVLLMAATTIMANATIAPSLPLIGGARARPELERRQPPRYAETSPTRPESRCPKPATRCRNSGMRARVRARADTNTC